MKSIVHKAFGAPQEVLSFEDVDVPTIGPEDVLVSVRATAVAKGDWLITQGLPYIARPSYGIRHPKQKAKNSAPASTPCARPHMNMTFPS